MGTTPPARILRPVTATEPSQAWSMSKATSPRVSRGVT